MTARTACHITAVIGLAWAAYGLGTTLTNVGVGLAVAAAAIIGADYTHWQQK